MFLILSYLKKLGAINLLKFWERADWDWDVVFLNGYVFLNQWAGVSLFIITHCDYVVVLHLHVFCVFTMHKIFTP